MTENKLKNKLNHELVFLPKIEDFVVGSISGESVHNPVPCVELVFRKEVCVHGGILCPKCMFIILPEPSHDTSIRD